MLTLCSFALSQSPILAACLVIISLSFARPSLSHLPIHPISHTFCSSCRSFFCPSFLSLHCLVLQFETSDGTKIITTKQGSFRFRAKNGSRIGLNHLLPFTFDVPISSRHPRPQTGITVTPYPAPPAYIPPSLHPLHSSSTHHPPPSSLSLSIQLALTYLDNACYVVALPTIPSFPTTIIL